MNTAKHIIILVMFALSALLADAATTAAPDDNSALLRRVYAYSDSLGAAKPDSVNYAYSRFLISTDKRNVLLMAVPTMYGVAHSGARQFAGESIDRIRIDSLGQPIVERVAVVNTIRRGRSALSMLLQYLTPQIYSETILENTLLSPFHAKNQRFYRYRFIRLDAHTTRIIFKARVDNTQLVSGRATVETATGRIITTDLYGEFDMIRFRLSVEMGGRGQASLLPLRCQLMSRFKFLGSKISASHFTQYGLTMPATISVAENDHSNDENDLSDTPKKEISLADAQNLPLEETEILMEKMRPVPLPELERSLIENYHALHRENREREAQRAADTTLVPPKKNLAKTIFWDILGDHILNSTKSRFGNNDQGYFRINPILNPLYFGYSDRKGIVYKIDVRAGYDFTPNREIYMRFKGGYSFKQRQFYYWIPFRFYYNKRRHAYFAVDLEHGRHIYNGEIEKDFSQTVIDSLRNLGQQLDFFRDTYVNIYNNYDLSDYWSFNVGMSIHRRKTMTPEAFRNVGLPTSYRSTAPRVEIQYRPIGWKGPVVTLDYERNIKGFFGSNTEYERWEIDGSYIYSMPRLQAWSMRLGGGLYTKKGQRYFLDFANFRENNIPNGWNDDWSGDFELLNSEWYNNSRYYVRANGTYESPLLMTSWLPWVGHFIEMERVYLGAVMAEKLHPYVEAGYSFTTRWLSVAAFVGSRNGRFERVGFAFGFELFRKW